MVMVFGSGLGNGDEATAFREHCSSAVQANELETYYARRWAWAHTLGLLHISHPRLRVSLSYVNPNDQILEQNSTAPH